MGSWLLRWFEFNHALHHFFMKWLLKPTLALGRQRLYHYSRRQPLKCSICEISTFRYIYTWFILSPGNFKTKKKKITRCRDRALKEMFPRLYTIAHRKDAAVADLMRWRADQIVWDISFYRALHDWEQGIITDFLSLIYSICWKPIRIKLF